MPETHIIRIRSFEYRFRVGRYEWRRAGVDGPWFEDPYTPAEYAALAALGKPPEKEVAA
jgi:hypothetical protein